MRVFIYLCAATTLLHCSAAPPAPDAPQADASPQTPTRAEEPNTAPDHVSLPTTVRLSDKVLQDAGIVAAPVYAEVLPVTVELTGEVAFDPDRAAHVTARAPGRIVAVHFKEGDHVTRGAPLAVIESPVLSQDRAALSVATTRLALARKNAQRLNTLAEKALASPQEAALAQGEQASAEAQAQAAAQTLASYGLNEQSADTGARLTIRAPISGYALTRHAIIGQVVAPEALLATLADFDEAYFVGRLFEKDLALTSPGSVAEVRLNAYPELPFVGLVESIGRQIDPVARTAVARVRIKNQDGALKAGLFGVAKLTAGSAIDRARTLAAPLTAVTQIGGRDVVFVQEPGGEFALHAVTLGRSAAGKVQVLAGLNQAEQVVHNGVFVLKSAVLKATFGEED